MHHHYEDIRLVMSSLGQEPKWFDEHAVPRYCEFSPDQAANIYADEVALVLITCQACGREFRVCFSLSDMDRIIRERGSLADEIRTKELHYGDPPNVGCCMSGPTMNSEPRRVLQYWHRRNFDWARDASSEIAIEPDWVTEGGDHA